MSSDDHGHTPAAWTAVTIMIVGFTLGGAATLAALPWLVLASLGVVLLGPVVGKIMAAMGMGAPPRYQD